MKPFNRSDRVGGQIQKILSDLLHKDIKDPRLSMAVITAVKLSRDLRSARVYFAVNGARTEQDRQQALLAFDSARGFVKRTLAGLLGLRYMPDLKFYHDDSFDYGAHIDGILRSLNIGNESDPTEPKKQ